MSSSSNNNQSSDSENENNTTIQQEASSSSAAADGSVTTSSGAAATSTIDYFTPVGVSDDGKPTYDRTGITIHDMKKHEGKDGKPLCAFGGNVCTQRPMKTFDFCVKHVLQDPTAPFKRCEYMGKGSKQCGNPVKLEAGEDIRYCNTHKQKMGITPKKKKSEEKTPSKRGRKKKEETETTTTTPEGKVAAAEQQSSLDVPPSILPSSITSSSSTDSRETSTTTTTLPASPATTATTTSTTLSSIPTNSSIITLSTSLEPILPYPINCATNNNNEDTDSDDYTGVVSKPFDTRKEQQKPSTTTPKKSPAQKRKRKFSKNPQQQTTLFAGSDTESDVPTDDEECVEETFLYPPYSTQGNVQCLTEMEFLRIRKHHIESLLKLYRGRHKKMRNELERKYTEFLIQRELAANSILEQTSINADIKIRLKKVNYNAYYNPKNRMSDSTTTGGSSSTIQDSVVLPTVNFPPENQQVYQCTKVEKYHKTTKEPLCCHPNCFSKRLLGVEFCLQHIIYDQKQRLYVPSSSTTGSTAPPLYVSSSDVNTKIPKEATLAERTIVVIENANKLSSAPQQWQINPEQDQQIQNLLKKLKGVVDDPMQIDTTTIVPISSAGATATAEDVSNK